MSKETEDKINKSIKARILDSTYITKKRIQSKNNKSFQSSRNLHLNYNNEISNNDV